MTRTGKFLILISGARTEVLERCPTERVKFQSLGWAILITSVMAVVSMWFALTSVLGFNPVLSVPFAVLWGLIIMGIDRWLVTSMTPDGKRKFLVAAPRLVLAILLGALISTPIVLRIFQSEINNQISVIKQDNEAVFLSSPQHNVVVAQVTKWQNDVNNLEQVIDSHGQKPINPADDPVVQGLTSQLKTAQSNASSDYHAWQCQLYGGCGSPKGNGPLAAASEKRYNTDETEITKLNGEIQTRDQALQATDASSQATRLQQAEGALPGAKANLTVAQNEENTLLNNFNSTNNSTNGVLIRLKALDQITAGNSTLQTARLLLFLLFLIIEILPVTVKLIQPAGNYEKILSKEIENELYQAKLIMRPGRAGFGGQAPARDPGSSGSGAQAGPAYTPPERDELDAELEAVWNQHTRAEPVHGWESRTPTANLEPEDTGPQRMDEVLRGLSDPRSADHPDEGQGGVERRYRKGDL